MKHNIILDATVLSSLMSCARYTDLRFNHHLIPIGPKSKSLVMGSIVHKVLEEYYKSIINRKPRGYAIDDGIKAGQTYINGCSGCSNFEPNGVILLPLCGHKVNEYPGVSIEPNDSAWAIKTCEQYFEFYKNDSWIPISTESVVSKILYEDDEMRILWKAKLDLLADTNQAILPIDHKTMQQRRDSVSLNNQFIGQCLVCDTRQMIINKVGFQTSLKPTEKFTRVVMNYSTDRLLEWQSEILPYYASMLIQYNERGVFPPNFTNCESKFGPCDFISVCESNRNMREETLKANFIVGPEWNPTND